MADTEFEFQLTIVFLKGREKKTFNFTYKTMRKFGQNMLQNLMIYNLPIYICFFTKQLHKHTMRPSMSSIKKLNKKKRRQFITVLLERLTKNNCQTK